MKKIISIVGARPQFIKLAPLSKKLRNYYREIIVHTGQHYDVGMSDSFFRDLDIPKPDYNLDVGSGKQGEQTASMLTKTEDVLIKENPDAVIVFGDTNSTIAGALAAVKLGIRTIHVEAGLRSFNRSMPEEINRVVSDHICDLLFAPTITAVNNLKDEGLTNNVYNTGDIMADVLLENLEKITDNKSPGCSDNPYYLLTLHRPYNVDDISKLKRILDLLNKTDVEIVFPVHPRTKSKVDEFGINKYKNIKYINPLSYTEFLKAHLNCSKVITDSGGIQKEAYLIKKPCITLRSETEWVETVESKWNLLLSEYSDDLPDIINNFNPAGEHPELFGRNVAEKMVEIIRRKI